MNARLLRRARVATVAFALAAIGAPAAQAQGDRFIPGYTDFPNALRIDGASANGARYTPGHTDFPNHLRIDSVYDRARANGGADEQVVVIAAPDARGFDWTDAGIGAGGAAVLLLAIGLTALALRRPLRGAAVAVVVAIGLAAPALARADAVTDWNQNAVDVIIKPTSTGAGFAGQPPNVAILHLAMVHAAVYDAVNAIDGGYQPYLGPLAADPLYSKEAAGIVAAHDVLVGLTFLTGAEKAALTAKRDLDLLAIADGPAKSGGMAVGAAAASRLLLARANDGRFGPFRLPGNLTGIGEWRPLSALPAANDPNAWVARVTPFLIGEADRFRSDGPYAVSSPEYTAEYDEVKSLGSASSTTRTADQTDAARFWAEHAVSMWTRIVRQLSATNGLSLVDNARLFAMVYLTAADGVIAGWDEKAHWLFWRPITAIREGDNDGNPATVGDPAWTPLLGTPPYPDHVSGHSVFSGSVAETLKDFFGTDKMDFSATSTNSGTTRSFDRFTKAAKEVVDARVWSGIHFMNADIDGYHVAKAIAKYRDRNYFQPVGS